MSAQFTRDSRWRMIKPGLYVDPNGFGHVFPDEVCAELGWPYTRENYEIVVAAMRRFVGLENVIIADHERVAEA